MVPRYPPSRRRSGTTHARCRADQDAFLAALGDHTVERATGEAAQRLRRQSYQQQVGSHCQVFAGHGPTRHQQPACAGRAAENGRRRAQHQLRTERSAGVAASSGIDLARGPNSAFMDSCQLIRAVQLIRLLPPNNHRCGALLPRGHTVLGNRSQSGFRHGAAGDRKRPIPPARLRGRAGAPHLP